MYKHVEKVHKMQIWREELSELKQDGPNRYLGACQYPGALLPKRVSWANNRRSNNSQI